MQTYIVLVRWTQKGRENIKESPARLEAAKDAFLAMGARVVGTYMVIGEYDLVLIAEAPDDETMTRIALALASAGNVRTQTLRAYTEIEFRSLVEMLP